MSRVISTSKLKALLQLKRHGVNKFASRIGLKALPGRRGPHGGNLFLLDDAAIARFPEDAQIELMKRSVPEQKVDGGKYPSTKDEQLQGKKRSRQLAGPLQALSEFDLNGVSPKVVRWADARAELCLHFRSYSATVDGTQGALLTSFVEGYNAANIVVSDATRELIPAISAASLYRWFRHWREGGVAALVPRYQGSKCIIETTPGMADHILAQISYQPHVRATRIHEGLAVRFKKVPSQRAVQEFVAKWKREHPALFMRLKDPDDFKRRFSVALGKADAKITRVNALWEIDGTPADAFCRDGVFHANCLIDVFSRRMIALLTPTASAEATAALLRKALPVMGIPDEIKSDWGKEYLNARIERAAARIGIKWRKVARPYSGELKPFIERGQGTILHNFFEQCPGYKGHSTKGMAEIRAQRSFQQRRGERRNLTRIYNIELSSAELQDLLDRWLASVYGERAHAGLLGKAPNAVFGEADAAGQVKRVAEERVLDLWLAEDGVATVGAKGLRVSSTCFWADELIAWRGRKVQFSRTADAGQLLVYSDDGKDFICVAENYDAVGIDRQIIAIAARAREKQFMSEQLAELRRARRAHKPEKLLPEIINLAEARRIAALAPGVDKIASLPHRSPSLDASGKALAAVMKDVAHRSAPPIVNDLHSYDEQADIEAAVARYLALREKPRADWTAEDRDFMELAPGLPEIQALGRRAVARPTGDLDDLGDVLIYTNRAEQAR